MSAIPNSLAAQPKGGIKARALRLHHKSGDADSISFVQEDMLLRRDREDQVIIKITAAGVNPSDVKAAMGMMPHALFPRTPGRDFAGVVVEGPGMLLGQEVFGTGGDVGIRRDGSHASHLLLDAAALTLKPANLTAVEAAGIGVPFVTAWEGFRRAGMPKPGEAVLVMGANGKVGQAAIQIATLCGANTIGVVRKLEAYRGHANAAVTVLDHSSVDVAAKVRELTSGRGADIVYNTVGDPYYAAATAALALKGRQIFIAAVKKIVEFDIFAFYRGRHTYLGIDTLAFTAVESAELLREMAPHFASGKLKPFPIHRDFTYRFNDAKAAYQTVIGSSPERVVLVPED